MKVLHILNDLQFSGAETMLASAYKWFRKAGVESHMLSTGHERGPFADQLEQRGYVIHHIPFVKSFRFFHDVRRLVIAEKFDIVHIHCERAYLPYVLALWRQAKLVRTICHFFRFTELLRLRKIVERWLCKNIFGVTVLMYSAAVLENEKAKFFSRGTHAEGWYDESVFFTRSEDDRINARSTIGLSDEFVCVSLGTNTIYKNYDIIIRAIASFGTERKIQYVHVGDQGADMPLTKLAAELGVTARTSFPGRVASALTYLQAADCYLMPSREEGFGVAALEAMAVGLPVVLSSRPCLTDFSIYSAEIMYADLSPEEFAAQIVRLADLTQARRMEIGADLSQIIRKHFASQIGAGRYLQTYQQLMIGEG